MRKLINSIVMNLGGITLSAIGFAMEFSHDRNMKQLIHHESTVSSGVEEKSPLRKYDVQDSDNNPILFSVLNLTSDIVECYRNMNTRVHNNYDSFPQCTFQNKIQPGLLHHTDLNYFSDWPGFTELKIPISRDECPIYPFFCRGVNTNYSSSVVYYPNGDSSFPLGSLYILRPLDISSTKRYVWEKESNRICAKIDCFVCPILPDFKRITYLFSADKNCPFNSLPAELKLVILSKTFMIWPDKKV